FGTSKRSFLVARDRCLVDFQWQTILSMTAAISGTNTNVTNVSSLNKETSRKKALDKKHLKTNALKKCFFMTHYFTNSID
ncbi:hypothetical protein NOM07_19845, partial [Proteus terrae]|nr:hypothetical protein [Proteus terrae]